MTELEMVCENSGVLQKYHCFRKKITNFGRKRGTILKLYEYGECEKFCCYEKLFDGHKLSSRLFPVNYTDSVLCLAKLSEVFHAVSRY